MPRNAGNTAIIGSRWALISGHHRRGPWPGERGGLRPRAFKAWPWCTGDMKTFGHHLYIVCDEGPSTPFRWWTSVPAGLGGGGV